MFGSGEFLRPTNAVASRASFSMKRAWDGGALKEFVGPITFSDEKCLHTIERKWPLHERSLAFPVNGAKKLLQLKKTFGQCTEHLLGIKTTKNLTRKGTPTIKNCCFHFFNLAGLRCSLVRLGEICVYRCFHH